MKTLFQIAKEEQRSDDPIVVRGPLGESITQALNQVYAKVDPETGEPTPEGGATDDPLFERPALESQAQEVTVIQELVNAVNHSPSPAVQQGVDIYAVGADDVTPETVVDVINDMDDSPREYVVIADVSAPQAIDGTGDVERKTIDLTDETPAIESIRQFEAEIAPPEADDKELHDWFERVEGVAQEAFKSGFVLDFSIDRQAVARRKSRASLEALQRAVWANGGRFFYSLEDYVEALRHPEQPELGRSPETVPEPGQAQKLTEPQQVEETPRATDKTEPEDQFGAPATAIL